MVVDENGEPEHRGDSLGIPHQRTTFSASQVLRLEACATTTTATGTTTTSTTNTNTTTATTAWQYFVFVACTFSKKLTKINATVCVILRLFISSTTNNYKESILLPALRLSFNNPCLQGEALSTHAGFLAQIPSFPFAGLCCR